MNYVELLENPLVAILILVIICGLAVLLAYVSEKALTSAKAEGIVSFDPVEDPKDILIRQLQQQLELAEDETRNLQKKLKVAEGNALDADQALWACSCKVNLLNTEVTDLRKKLAQWEARAAESRLRGRALRAELSELRERLQSLDGLKRWAGNTQLTPLAPNAPTHLPKEVRQAKVTIMVTLANVSPQLKRQLGL